eukprot:c25598_g1_i1 orf=404-1996(-)
MSFHNLTQDLPLPHFSNNMQDGAARFSERASLHSDQEGIRRILGKDTSCREHILDHSKCTDLPHPLTRALEANTLQDHCRTTSSGRDTSKDAKDMNDKVSFLSEGTASMKMAGPTWLNNALLRQQSGASFADSDEDNKKWCGCEPDSQCVHSTFLHLQTQPAGVPTSSDGNAVTGARWLSTPIALVNKRQSGASTATAEVVAEDVPSESIMALSKQQSHGSADINQSSIQGRGFLDLHSDTANSSDLVDGDTAEHDHHNIWQTAKLKADVLSHPLYEQLLAAHVACLRIATPVDQLPRIDAQLAQSQNVLTKYSVLGQNCHILGGDEKDDLDQFMTHYVLLLCSFKEQLQQHVRVHAMEAVMACWDLEQSLLSLTGVSPGEGTGATMSDDEDDQEDSDPSLYDSGLDGHDTGGFGPLIPTESERSLMDRVRQELKNELKQGYRDRIVDVREEILRKRRAGKLPGDTTSVLKSWWHTHSKWPYPTEDEKARLVQETGLQLKQINNWFINQRKRNWHSNPTSASVLKSKRKR